MKYHMDTNNIYFSIKIISWGEFCVILIQRSRLGKAEQLMAITRFFYNKLFYYAFWWVSLEDFIGKGFIIEMYRKGFYYKITLESVVQ